MCIYIVYIYSAIKHQRLCKGIICKLKQFEQGYLMVYYCKQIKCAKRIKVPNGNILRTILLRYILPSLFSVSQPLLLYICVILVLYTSYVKFTLILQCLKQSHEMFQRYHPKIQQKEQTHNLRTNLLTKIECTRKLGTGTNISENYLLITRDI